MSEIENVIVESLRRGPGTTEACVRSTMRRDFGADGTAAVTALLARGVIRREGAKLFLVEDAP